MTADVALPPALDRLRDRVSPTNEGTLPPLQPTKLFDATLTSEIDEFVEQSFDGRPSVRAALHLLNDDIKRAHSIAQDDEASMSSNLCHAILHRREGDFWNSKWWYGQIRHPLIEQVYGGTSKARAFVDAVESMVKGGVSTPCAARNVEQLKRRQADELAQLVTFVMQEKD